VSLNINMAQTGIHPIVGGLAGSNYGGTIRKSSYSGTFDLSQTCATPSGEIGGIAGRNEKTGTIESCYASPQITITTNISSSRPLLYTGGLAGTNIGTIRNSYAACGIEITVTRNDNTLNLTVYSGGVVGGPGGKLGDNLIENCYAAGSLQTVINGTLYSYDRVRAGGISGGDDGSYSYGTVSSSAALIHTITIAGAVSGSRIVPFGTGTLVNNIAFNNMSVNGAAVADAVTDPENDANGLGKTAAQLANQETYETGLGWDFANVWEMGPPQYPYPMLKWQKGTIPALPQGFELLKDEP
jgi:hypothetical protein